MYMCMYMSKSLVLSWTHIPEVSGEFLNYNNHLLTSSEYIRSMEEGGRISKVMICQSPPSLPLFPPGPKC